MDVIRIFFKSNVETEPCCEKQNIIDADERVCTNCGSVHGHVFVTRYNHGCRPLYIYSRLTRFHNTMNRFGVVNKEIEILFARVERAWRTKKYKRKYFLSLKFLVFNLSMFYGFNLRDKHGVSIKDPARLKTQQIILKDLLFVADREKALQYYSLLGIHF